MRHTCAVIVAILITLPLAGDNPSAAAPAMACHVSLKIPNVGTCSESSPSTLEQCRPNECLLRVYEIASASSYVYKNSPPCGSDVSAYTKRAAETVIKMYIENPAVADELAGRVAGPLTDLADDLLRKGDGLGDVGKYLISPYSNQNSVCVPIMAVVPAKSRILRYAVAAADTTHGPEGVGFCPINTVCEALPWSAFEDYSQTTTSPDKPTVASVILKNWRSDKGRRGVLTVWFTAPKGKLTPLNK